MARALKHTGFWFVSYRWKFLISLLLRGLSGAIYLPHYCSLPAKVPSIRKA